MSVFRKRRPLPLECGRPPERSHPAVLSSPQRGNYSRGDLAQQLRARVQKDVPSPRPRSATPPGLCAGPRGLRRTGRPGGLWRGKDVRASVPAEREGGRGVCPVAASVRTARHTRKPAPSGRHAVLLSTFSVGRGDVTASLRLCSFEARAKQTARGRCSLTPRSPWNLSPHWSLDKLQGSSESSPKAGDGGERAAERSLRPWQSPCSGARPSSPSPSAGRAP